MKKNNSKFAKRLSQYGSLAIAIAGVSEADGQVIYTDVDPDFSGSVNSSFAIDFDSDGTIDVEVINSSSQGDFYLYASANPNAAFLGSLGYYFYAYPFALTSGDNISSGAGSFIGGYSNIMNYNGGVGNWIGVNDRYLGVKFEISGQTHYGWVRLDVNADATFTVKDYAYDATPNVGITAGDLSVESSDFMDFSFYPNPVGENLMLKANNTIDKIIVYDLLGKEILSENPNENDFEINMSHLENGTYFMEVSINGNSKAFKLEKI